MSYLGISAGFHDAAISLVGDNGQVIFAGHSERYSKNKNDRILDPELINEVINENVTSIAYYERPWNKQLRQSKNTHKIPLEGLLPEPEKRIFDNSFKEKPSRKIANLEVKFGEVNVKNY